VHGAKSAWPSQDASSLSASTNSLDSTGAVFPVLPRRASQGHRGQGRHQPTTTSAERRGHACHVGATARAGQGCNQCLLCVSQVCVVYNESVLPRRPISSHTLEEISGPERQDGSRSDHETGQNMRQSRWRGFQAVQCTATQHPSLESLSLSFSLSLSGGDERTM
jgi:hypothetical protein